jgi:hypothetical protein
VKRLLVRKIENFKFLDGTKEPITVDAFKNIPLIINFPKLKNCYTEETVLLSIPKLFEVSIINRSYSDDEVANIVNMRRAGCFYFNEENEWLLRVITFMKTDDGSAIDAPTMYLPLSAPFMKNAELSFYFDGAVVRLLNHGEIINQNAALAQFNDPEGEIYINPEFTGVTVEYGFKTERFFREETQDITADFYSPYHWNTFAGDVMTFYHDGTYHLMYLLDRRHHASRGGSHYICQLTTKDLINWYEQVPIAEIDKPWKTYGTGTMFFKDGKYYMTYGYHSYRYPGNEKRIKPLPDENYAFPTPLSMDEIMANGDIPEGASYSVSDDGINFKNAGLLIHKSENPSAYCEGDKILLYCGYGIEGIWEGETIDGGFYHSKNNFKYHATPPMRASSECPAKFSWNGYNYLAVGFTGYYRTLEPNTENLVDAAALGESFYDGLCVPMVSKIFNDRYIMAGWINGVGWGSSIVFRELIQEEKGVLGKKWVPELTPKTKGAELSDNQFATGQYIDEKQSYMLELEIDPQKAQKGGLQFINGEKAVELQFNFKENRAQIGETKTDVMCERVKTILEALSEGDPAIDIYTQVGATEGVPSLNFNRFAITVKDIDKPFNLKVICRYSKKLRATVIDAEIAGCRTLVSMQPNFFPNKIKWLSNGETALKRQSLKILDWNDNYEKSN